MPTDLVQRSGSRRRVAGPSRFRCAVGVIVGAPVLLIALCATAVLVLAFLLFSILAA